MRIQIIKVFLLFLVLGQSSFLIADSKIPTTDTSKQIATLRKGVSLFDESQEPEPLQNESNKDLRRERAYPMQPPTIPHTIENYQLDFRANKCLTCHARTKTQQSQAPMVSVTHFMDRDGNFLADISPRRYFCTQCHVTQIERDLIVKNTFIAVEELISDKESEAQ